MIFVTVGTHEQQFNRLIEYMDKWAEEHNEKVVFQTGYCSYRPQNSYSKVFYSYSEMIENYNNARIVITHGGPSSFLMSLMIGKIPIIVPRNPLYGEHINNHQIDFCKRITKKNKNLIIVYDILNLSETIDKYDEITKGREREYVSNNTNFCIEFEKLTGELMK